MKSLAPVKTIDDITTLDAMAQEATSKLIYPMGSLLKISGHYLSNFCIEIPVGIKPGIEKLSLQKYFDGWKRAGKLTMDAIKTATREAGFPLDNSNLNEHVGKMTVEVLRAMAEHDKTKTFTIVDIGAGEGETTRAVFDAILHLEAFELAERCEFILIEPSKTNLMAASDTLEEHGVHAVHPIPFSIIGKTNHDFLGRLKDGSVDMAISSAVFHHMIFPSYLSVINECLVEGGVLVVGDWYTSVFNHPALVAEILEELDIERDQLKRFQSIFDVSPGEAKDLSSKLNADERYTNKRMRKYIVAIGQKFLKIPPEQRDEFLEGHTSYHERKQDLDRSGFLTDFKDLKGHPGFSKLSANVRDLEPYGAAKVGAFVKSHDRQAFAVPAAKLKHRVSS